MFRTLITIGLSVVVGISSTLIVQHMTLSVAPPAPIACATPPHQEEIAISEPQGHLLKLPGVTKGPWGQ